jgi:hypothetical protein
MLLVALLQAASLFEVAKSRSHCDQDSRAAAIIEARKGGTYGFLVPSLGHSYVCASSIRNGAVERVFSTVR